MGRPKKPTNAQNGNINKDDIAFRKQAETAVDQKAKTEFKEVPKDLVNPDAIKVWKNWVEYLKDIGFYGNVTVPELIGYCNAWAMYVKTQRKLKRASLEQADKLAGTIKKYSEEMTRCMNRGGFSVTSRLNYAETKMKGEMEQINSEFGI